MKHYTKITIWENRRRLEKLSEFKNLVLKYFKDIQYEEFSDEPLEGKSAIIARGEINRVMDEVRNIILRSGIDTSVKCIPPPITGGYISDVDLIISVLHIRTYDIAKNRVLDLIDRAIGIYENNHRHALMNTFNPLFYIGIVIDWIVNIPFVFIGRIGFNREKAESSIPGRFITGRFIKGILWLVTTVPAFGAAILTILYLLGYLEPVKLFVRQVFGSN